MRIKKLTAGFLAAVMCLSSLTTDASAAINSQQKDSAAKEGVLVHYDMSNDGSYLLDQSGHGYHAPMRNTGRQTFEEEEGLGTVLHFPGGTAASTNSFYVELPLDITEGDQLTQDKGFTVSYVAKTSTSALQFGWVLGTNYQTDYIFINPRSSADSNGVRGGIRTGSAAEARFSVRPVLDITLYNEIVLTSEGQTLSLYCNGEFITNLSHSFNVDTILKGDGKSILGYLGKSVYSDPYFEGYVSEFTIYDYPMDAQAVAEEYKSSAYYISRYLQEAADNVAIDTELVRADINLPVSWNDVDITWTSRDPDVIEITEDGTVGRICPAATEVLSAELEAVFRYGGLSITREFLVTVAPTDLTEGQLSMRLALDQALAAVTADADNKVYGNVTLLEEVDGVTLSWKSSNSRVITDEARENLDHGKKVYFDAPAGEVTRGTQAATVTLTVTAELENEEAMTEETEVTVLPEKEEEAYAAYLYAYFREYAKEGQSSEQEIYFAVSENGLDWTQLNENEPVVESELGEQKVRDPFIIRSAEGDKFYLVGTDLDIHLSRSGPVWIYGQELSQDLMVWESDDLVNWHSQRAIPVGESLNAGMCWAPEAVYDKDTGEYLLFWSSKVQKENGTYEPSHIYVSRTRDFYNFTDPELYSENNLDQIDASIFYESYENTRFEGQRSGMYYRTIKNVTRGGIDLSKASYALAYYEEGSAEELANTYMIGNRAFVNRGDHFTNITQSASNALSSFTGGYEGPTMFRYFDREEWCILVDEFSGSVRGYLPFVTADPEAENSALLMADNTYAMPDGAKHGTVIPITQSEYDALMEEYGTIEKQYGNETETNDPVLAYDFEDQEPGTISVVKDQSGNTNTSENLDASAYGTTQYVYDAEKEGTVLYLDGNNSYMEFPEGFFDGLDQMTVSMDMKILTTANFHFDFAVGRDSYRYMFLRVRNNAIRNAITTYRSAYEREVTMNGTSLLGQWINVTVVMDGHTMYLYVDGELADIHEHVRSISEMDSGVKAYLGKSFYSGDGYTTGYYDNLLVYNRSLDADEVYNLYNGTEEPELNYEGLDELLVTADSLNMNQYTYDSWNRLLEAYNEAKAVRNNASQQRQLDEASQMLDEALEALEQAAADPWYLKFVIGLAEDLKAEADAAVPVVKTLFYDAYNASTAQLAAAEADARSTALKDTVETALTLLGTFKWLDYVLGDTTMLEQLLAEAQEILDLADEYVAESIEGLQELVDEATELLKDENLLDAWIIEMADRLEAAIDKAERKEDPGPQDPDRSLLWKVLQEAAEILDNIDAYRPSTVEGLKAAYDQAMAVYKDPEADQAAINEAVKQLTAETAKARMIPDKDVLAGLVNKAGKLNRSLYSAASLAKLDEAQAAAAAVLNDPDADEKEVKAAVLLMQNALDNLKLKEEKKPDPSTDKGNTTTKDTSKTGSGSGKTANNGGAKTGDTAPVMAVIMMMIMMTGLLVISRRRRSCS